MKSIGPTASWIAIIVMLVFGGCLVYFLAEERKTAYILLSPIGMLGAIAAIVGAFTNDPTNWPSEFWRWAGVAVNAVGLVGFILALVFYFKPIVKSGNEKENTVHV